MFQGVEIISTLTTFLFSFRELASSPYINRFLQPDTIIPDLSNPQSWNRYSYVTNRPVNFNDPTGHRACGDTEEIDCDGKSYKPTPPIPPKEPPVVGSGGSNNCNGPNPSVVCRPPVIDLELDIAHAPTQLPSTVEYFYTTTSQTTLPNACTAPSNGRSLADALGGLRTLCGQIDPFIPGEFTGTDLGYIEAVRQAAQSLEAVGPGNPVTKYAMPVVAAAPMACAAYDCVYDISTKSGEYYDAISPITQNMSVTPEGVIYTILAVLTLIPGIPPFP